MSIDMSQFYQVFFEEAQEHLDSMESLLLNLDIIDPDGEQLNAIFRAAHSIKGSAGTFGFTDLAEVTHVLENLLDRIRKGELGLRPEMIDAFLDAGDVLKDLLAAHRGDGVADPLEVAAMCKRLSELTINATRATVPPVAAKTKPISESAALLDVSFVLDMDAQEATTTVDNLIAELGQRWTTEVSERAVGTETPWRLSIAAEADQEIVRGLLEFIARSDSIRIKPAGAQASDTENCDDAYGFFDEAAPSAASQADQSWGLFDTGAAAVAGPTPATVPATDDSWGLFDSDTAAVAASVQVAVPATDDSFGFFVDLPSPAAEPAAAPAPPQKIPVSAAPAAKTETADRRQNPTPDRRSAPRPAGGGETSIRVDVDKVDQLINLIGELVITQAMLAQSASALDPVEFERLHNGLGQLERNTRDMQESVMSIRMMPISVVFSRFPRVVRDLAQKLGKQIELKTIGETTELDKSLIERISDPLTHLVRNSLDHGIEMPEERVAKGKPPVGTITLKAYHQGGSIVIEVGDDGAGLSRQKILAKAREKGMPVNDQMSDNEVWLLIFDAGFSTADQVTEVSGRGVGMDVVKRNITGMGGRVEIESMIGIGTRITVRLPLTLAILDGMSVAAGKETYIIPLGYIVESLQAEPGMIKSVSGVERVIQVREEFLPVMPLYEMFGIPDTITQLDKGIMVVLEADGAKAALFIDALVGQHQVVIKSLESNYRKVPGISGATIMGDGHVAMILDVSALVQMAKSSLPAAA
ncbi:MAG: chemotaxis protein CheW [Sulfuritalea sp.]|nr:chemotaxis protein CheW [Sulfuritalea sp.]